MTGVAFASNWQTQHMSTPRWKVLLSPPEVGEIERSLLIGAFDSGWIAPAGPDLDAFERELAAVTGAEHVVALSSGTAALHLALEAVGVGPGDDVLVSTLTFGASAFAASYLGARPCFIDAEPATWHMDPDLLAAELDRRAADGTLPGAVIGVDLYGSVADNARLFGLCEAAGVHYIEDAAEAIGASRDGFPAGRHSRVAALSFNGNKMVTTGGGGALVSDDPRLIDRARYLATQSRDPVPWYEHSEIGFNYRLSNLAAGVGRGQLITLDERIAQRRRVRRRYEMRLAELPGVTFQAIPPDCSPNHWLTTVAFDAASFGASRDQLLHALRSAGIEARHGFKPMHMQPVFAGLPTVGGGVAEHLFATTMSLPSGARLTDDDVDQICEILFSVRNV